jgi:hypothetical protein
MGQMDRRTSHKAKISLKHYFPLVLVLFTILPGLPAGAEDFGLIQGKTLMPDGTAISDVAILISSEDNDFRVTFTSDIS